MLGTRLGPYRIDAELGSGGMGRVYSATVEGRSPGLAEGARVALKVVHAHLLDAPGFFKRFLREGEIGKAVVHANVVRTYDCDAVRENHFLVMEYVEGQTLRALLDELERVPEELCRHVGREIAKGLAAIHAAGAVHRDLKPENVLITRDHAVKVMDLGVARLADEALRLSQTGAFVGSIHYAAPECFTDGGRDVDGRADLHALGLVLYELASGVNPYEAGDVPQTLQKILREEPRRLGDVNPQLSPFFEEVVHCLLAKRPGERFADAAALSAVLDEGERSAWWKTRAQSIREVTRRPLRRIRIPRETAVYGRETELALFRSLHERAAAGDGQVVVVEGEAGIGKSRVVDELVARLLRDGHDIHFLSGSYPPGGAATAAGAFSTAFREQFGDAGSAAYLTQTPRLVPAFDALLRGETTPSGVEPLTKDSLQTCFVHATRGLAAERTTVLLVDDLHFATDDARSLFASIALAVPGQRILLVGTTRPGIDDRWLADLTRLPHTSRVTLGRLGPKDLGALLVDSFRSEDLAQSLALQIGTKSDGNPFFAFEIIRGLREGQFITRRADGTWVNSRVIGDITIPSSVLDLVKARVADLGEDERNLLDVAACCGFEFDPLLVGEALGVARVPLLRALGQIERRHRLVRSSGLRYAFDHHQVQEALYGSLSELLRREYHTALATALEARTNAAAADPNALDGSLCVDLCEHHLRGVDARRAVRYLPAAQRHLQRGFVTAQAMALAERALAAPGLLTGPERAKVLYAHSMTLERVGRYAEEEAAAREIGRLAAEAGDERQALRAEVLLGMVLWRTSRLAEAEAAYGRAARLAEASGDRTVYAQIENGLGNVFSEAGRFEEAREHFARALAMHRESGNRSGEAAATVNVGVALDEQGRVEEAMEHYRRAVVLCREIGQRQYEVNVTLNIGSVLRRQGRLDEARDHFERVLSIAREIGSRLAEAGALGHLGDNRRETGDFAGAKEYLLAALAIREQMGDRAGVAAMRLGLAHVLLDAGETELGRKLTAEAYDAAAALGGAAVETETIARCRLAWLPGGDLAGAERCLAENAERLNSEALLDARWSLWRASGNRAHLEAAKRLLDDAVAKTPEPHRASMVANQRTNRDIDAAARAAGL